MITKTLLEKRSLKNTSYGMSAFLGVIASIPAIHHIYPNTAFSDILLPIASLSGLCISYTGWQFKKFWEARKTRIEIESSIGDVAESLGVDISKTFEKADIDESHSEEQIAYYENEFKELGISREAIKHLLTQQVLRADEAINNPWLGRDILDIAANVPDNMVSAFIKQREGQVPYYSPKVVRVQLAELIASGKVLMPISEDVLGPRKGATFVSPADLRDLRAIINQRLSHGPEAGIASEPPPRPVEVQKDLTQEVKTVVLGDDPHGFGSAVQKEVLHGDADAELTRLMKQDLPEDCLPENSYVEPVDLTDQDPMHWDSEPWEPKRKAQAARDFASYLGKGGIKLSNCKAWHYMEPHLVTVEETRQRLKLMNRKDWVMADSIRLLIALELVSRHYDETGEGKLEIEVVKQNTPLYAYLDVISKGVQRALATEDFKSSTAETNLQERLVEPEVKVSVQVEPVVDNSIDSDPVVEKPVEAPLLEDTSFAAAKAIAEQYGDELDVLIGSHRKHLFAGYVHDDVDLSELSNLDIRCSWRELGAKYPHIQINNELAAYVIAFRLAYERWQMVLNHEYKQELGVPLSEEARGRAKGLGYNFDGFVYPKAVTERARELSDNYDTNEIEDVRATLDNGSGEFSLGLVSTLMGMKAACEELNYTGEHDDYLRTNYVDSGNLKELMSEGINAMRDQGLVPRNREERRASQKAARKSGKTPKANMNRKQVKKAKRK